MEKITTVGIDLAKSVFSLHGVDGAGRVVLRRAVRRDQLLDMVAGLSPCLIGMEACSGAHEWGRRFQGHGHTVRLMAPKFVAPYRKSGKNDGNDAEAICEAVQERPPVRRLDRAGTGSILHRRQATPGTHQQAGRCVPAQPARPRRALGPPERGSTSGPHVALGARAAAAARLLPNARRNRQQEREHRLGAARQKRDAARGLNTPASTTAIDDDESVIPAPGEPDQTRRRSTHAD
jgi:transposase